MLRFLFPIVVPTSLLMGWVCSVQAQGQGSYGGIAQGFFSLALIVIVIGVALALLLVRAIFGTKTALALLTLLLVALSYFAVDARLAEAKRRSTYKEIARAFAQGCAETTRVIERTAKGDEHIYLRLSGVEQVPEHERSRLLPSKKLGPGVEIVSEVPSGATNAIVVDIRYSHDLVSGSYPGYEWHRTHYELTARTVPDGAVIAHTTDRSARDGFCLGDLDAFLQRALNRSAVFWGSGSVWRSNLADAYVQAKYTGTTHGVHLKSHAVYNPLDEAKKVLLAQNCQVKESNISSPVALCSAPDQAPVEVPLWNIVGIHRTSDSWLLVYRVHKGGEFLTSMRIEQRLSDWRLVRTWSANVAPISDHSEGGERLEEFAIDGETMTAVVYWGKQWDINRQQPITNWYANKSVLRVPLPGLSKG